MDKFLKWLKIEVDVEIFTCVHAVSMIGVYGFLLWLGGEPEVPFAVIFEMIILGYVMAWIQKALFLKEKNYSVTEYRVREILWIFIPMLCIFLCGEIFDWFTEQSSKVTAVFYVVMLIYLAGMWLVLRCFYEKDTEELNRLLKQRKEENHELYH